MPDFRTLALVAAIVASPAAAQPLPDSDVYTLYRDSVVPGIEKVHVATFDTSEGREYNRGNCMLARDLFQRQPGVKTNFWCEPGRATAVMSP